MNHRKRNLKSPEATKKDAGARCDECGGGKHVEKKDVAFDVELSERDVETQAEKRSHDGRCDTCGKGPHVKKDVASDVKRDVASDVKRDTTSDVEKRNHDGGCDTCGKGPHVKKDATSDVKRDAAFAVNVNDAEKRGSIFGLVETKKRNAAFALDGRETADAAAKRSDEKDPFFPEPERRKRASPFAPALKDALRDVELAELVQNRNTHAQKTDVEKRDTLDAHAEKRGTQDAHAQKTNAHAQKKRNADAQKQNAHAKKANAHAQKQNAQKRDAYAKKKRNAHAQKTDAAKRGTQDAHARRSVPYVSDISVSFLKNV